MCCVHRCVEILGQPVQTHPECDWAGPNSACQEKWACWTASQPGCSPLTRCRWTWSNPETTTRIQYLQFNKLKKLSSPVQNPRQRTFELSIISGALYQRVATYSVKKPVWSCSGSAIRARPKSQIWRRHKGSQVRSISLPADSPTASPSLRLFNLSS